MQGARRAAASPEWRARGFVLLVCASVFGIVGWRVGLARDLRLQESRKETTNLARFLAEHAHATMHVADVVIAGLVERLEHDGTGPAALERLQRHMVAQVGDVSALGSLAVLGPAGARLAGTQPGPSEAVQEGPERAILHHHLSNPGRGPYIGPPVWNTWNGAWVVTISRRFDAAAGGFGGVAAASIGLDTFARLYSTFDVGPQGAIVLANDDGTLLVRRPPLPAAIGKPLLHGPVFQDYRRLGPAGSAAADSALDGTRRLNSFREVDGYPLVVSASVSEADILAGWRGSALVAFVSAGAVSMGLGALGWRMAGQIRQRALAEAGVRQREQQYRLLADHGTDMVVMLGRDRRQAYVSPASARLLGHPPEALAGHDLLAFVHPDDRAAVDAALEALSSGGGTLPARYRARCRDGTWLWVEATGRAVPDEVGDGGLILSIRDVSARMAAEDALHQANNLLQRQAMQDGLTGISNRRCFDSVLAREMRRAARAELPLALLLVDVDRFKLFNDRYGHPAGDACLRAVAQAVEHGAQRGADLAARYGGEEFAVLLPETDAAGAAAIAERVCEAVRRLAVPHGEVPGGVVTVSIGVAAVWPQQPPAEGTDGTGLVRMADQALYRAKAEGRNRVCLDAPAITMKSGASAELTLEG